MPICRAVGWECQGRELSVEDLLRWLLLLLAIDDVPRQDLRGKWLPVFARVEPAAFQVINEYHKSRPTLWTLLGQDKGRAKQRRDKKQRRR